MVKTLGLVLVALGLALGIVQAAALSVQQVADIAKAICKHPKSEFEELRSVSSMLQVIKYFENDLEDKTCRDRWLSSMRYLEVVLTIGNENACGDDKLSALEEFNRRYISTSSEDKHNQKKDELKAPKALRVFFVHYANTVSTICKDNLAESIQKSGLTFGDLDGKPVDLSPIDDVVNRFMDSFALDIVKNGYNDVILPWKMIDQHHLSSLEKKVMPKSLDMSEATPTKLPVRLSLLVKDPAVLQAVQKSCIENMKPAYSRYILPAMRMINLGLYEDTDRLASLLASDETTQRMFKVALVCETLLPIEVFADDSLEEGKIISITPKRATELREQQPSLQSIGHNSQESDDSISANLSVEGIDEISSLADHASAKRLTKTLKANRIKQEGIIKRCIKLSKAMLKSKIKSKFGHTFLFSDSDDNHSVKQLEVEEESTTLVRTKRLVGGQIAGLVIVGILGLIAVILIGGLFGILYSSALIKFVKGLAWPVIRIFASKETYNRMYHKKDD